MSPKQEMCIDEAIVKYKGHIKGKVCMPLRWASRSDAVAVPVVGTSVHEGKSMDPGKWYQGREW